jgi:hypothetical protein
MKGSEYLNCGVIEQYLNDSDPLIFRYLNGGKAVTSKLPTVSFAIRDPYLKG